MKLIIDMPMPQTCEECPIGNYFHTNCPLQDDDKSYEQFQAYKKNERPSWCPIVGVLPEEHGDLIDRDKAIFEMCEGLAPMGYRAWAKRYLKSEKINPTVIPAERKDDGRTDKA